MDDHSDRSLARVKFAQQVAFLNHSDRGRWGGLRETDAIENRLKFADSVFHQFSLKIDTQFVRLGSPFCNHF